MSDTEIKFVKLSNEIKDEYLSLQVHDFQKGFIETPQRSLNDMKTNAWDIPWEIECIYAGNQIVGYFMHGINKYGDVWLDRFMIDRRYQGKGYGTLALATIMPMLKTLYPDRNRILLSVEPNNKSAVKLYEKFGFYLTGEIEDNEEVMMLKE